MTPRVLQVLEDGRLTDSSGRTVSFRQCLVILTSNVGSQLIAKGGAGLGFELETDDAASAAEGRLRSLVLSELKSHFRPEFLNRLDEIVVRLPSRAPCMFALMHAPAHAVRQPNHASGACPCRRWHTHARCVELGKRFSNGRQAAVGNTADTAHTQNAPVEGGIGRAGSPPKPLR